MCCRVVVSPIPEEVLDLLMLAGFRPSDSTLRAWSKQVTDGQVWVKREAAALEFNVQPAISAMDHHGQVRLAAACMFKVADIFAEAAGGSVTHLSNIGMCAAERGASNALVAAYPDMPLHYDRLCLGFRLLFGQDLDAAA